MICLVRSMSEELIAIRVTLMRLCLLTVCIKSTLEVTRVNSERDCTEKWGIVNMGLC